MKLLADFKMITEAHLPTLVVELSILLKKPSTVFLSADLGMGKTTFVAYFCSHLGIELTSSPTYSIHNRYQSLNAVVDHFDLYRLEDEDAVMASGFYDLMSEKTDFKIVEWPERLTVSAQKSFGRSYWLQIKKNADLESARDYNLFEI